MKRLSQRLWWALMGSVGVAICLTALIAALSVRSYATNGVDEEIHRIAERMSRSPWIPFRFIRYRPRQHIDDYALLILNQNQEIVFQSENWEPSFPQQLSAQQHIDYFITADGRHFKCTQWSIDPDENSRWRRRGRGRGRDRNNEDERGHERHDRVAYDKNMSLILYAEVTTLDQDLRSLYEMLAVVGAVVMLFALLIARHLRDTLLAPVNALSSDIAALQAHDIEARLETGDMPQELLLIHNRINELLDRLAHSRQRERRSIGDIAHELRTPLAALRSELEFASSAGDIPEERGQFMQEQVSTLQQRIDSLLLLMRLESEQEQLQQQSLSLVELINDAWSRQHDDTHQLHMDGITDQSIDCDPRLMAMVFDNLFSNAIAYSSSPEIGLSLSSNTGGTLQIHCSNACDGMQPGPCPQVFEAFWRDDQARSLNKRHYGLGLALVERIIMAHGAMISARISDEHVFHISITWPAYVDDTDLADPS